MLKVAPCAVVRSEGRTSKFFRLDGLLLFRIVIGLRSASSAIMQIGLRKEFLKLTFRALTHRQNVSSSLFPHQRSTIVSLETYLLNSRIDRVNNQLKNILNFRVLLLLN